MDFCSLADVKTPLGPYGVVLPAKARHALAARDFALFLTQRVSWVEDGLRVVILQMLAGEGNVSDYLRKSYPEAFAQRLRVTETNDPRRTLFFRLRYLLRCMAIVSERYLEFRHWSFTGLEMTLDVFVECVRQAVGEHVADRLRKSVARLSGLWSTVNYELDDAESVKREIELLLDDLDEVFEMLHDAFVKREVELAAENKAKAEGEARQEATDEVLSAMRKVQEEQNRLFRAGLRQNAALSVRRSADEPEDPYSRMAGLGRICGAKLEELKACFRYSHEKFAVVRGDKCGSHSLTRLAERVWRENRERFEGYARLKGDPGYKDARSLAAKLYKLAARHPEADHFLWQT